MGNTSDKTLFQSAAKAGDTRAERMLASMRTRLALRLAEKKIRNQGVAAIQREIEDEDLAEWRARMAEIKRNTA